MDLKLEDRVFIVAGGSRGLGRATAQALVDEGARVVLLARDPATIDAAVDALGRDRAIGIPGDLTDPEYSHRAIATAQAKYSRLDGALINSGGPPATGLFTTTDTQWREAFESVMLGPLRLARAVVSQARDGGSPDGMSLLFVLSGSALRPLPRLALSNALRPGLANLVREAAATLGDQGIRVNGLAPGRIDTDRVAELDAASGDARRSRLKHESTIPLGRYGQPEEFGRMAAFLLSPAASYITGVVVPVDGGAGAR